MEIIRKRDIFLINSCLHIHTGEKERVREHLASGLRTHPRKGGRRKRERGGEAQSP